MALSCFLLFLCFSASANAISAVNSDGKALLSLVRHWTVVPSSAQLNWNDSDSSSCSWVGVECDQKNQFVVALSLSGYKISGQLGPEITYLKHLKSVDLSMNRFSGVIPDFTENTNLLFMDLSNNRFSGGIPSSLGNLTNIISVDLSINKLSGPIPPEIGRLVDLQALNLSQNSLNSELPSQLSNCRKLLHLDVSHNFLNGSIPSSLRSLTELSTLTLSENGFTGNIPTFLFEFHKLSKLQLGRNMLGGNIPSTIGSLGAIQNLMLLNLSSNMLVGEVPIQLRGLIMLAQIDISCNNLSGSLRFLHDIPSLVFIDVSHNHFSGPIPSTLLKFLNSSPSSFDGNPALFQNCFALDCIGNRKSKSGTYQPSKKKGHRKTKIAFIVLGSSLSLGFLFVAFTKMFRQGITSHSTDHLVPESLRDAAYSIDDTLKATDNLNDTYIIGKRGLGMEYKVALSPESLRDAACLIDDILKATNNLNDMYIIGKGGQGTVYKVALSPDMVFVAKKHQFDGTSRGIRSMTTEIETIGKIRHRNLIQYLGFLAGENYGLVLYSYMENGSLHDLLHECKSRVPLDWKIRYKIALGTAHGLSYLHFDCASPILHRDIKPKNILLDNEFEPHISDFGLAVLVDSSAASSAARVLVGTRGYIAPENALKVRTKESDVYAYGVTLLELITRKKAKDPSFDGQPDIVSWIRSISDRRIEAIVDPELLHELHDQSVKHQVLRVLELALRCTQQDWKKRPLMKDVVCLLQQIQHLRWTYYSRPEVGSSSNS